MSDSDKYQNWAITTERYVAFIDIMGFKNMVATRDHGSMYEMMKDVKHSSLANTSIGTRRAPDKMDFLVRSTTYSDSIMIYSRDAFDNSLMAICMATSTLTSDMFLKKIPFRGAIAFGVMTLDHENSIFFGQPLINAYELQQELNFYGIAVHHSAEKKFPAMGVDIRYSSLDYNCPLKNGTVNHKTIYPNAMSYMVKVENAAEHRGAINGLAAMRMEVSGIVRKYVDNTEKYFDQVLVETEKQWKHLQDVGNRG